MFFFLTENPRYKSHNDEEEANLMQKNETTENLDGILESVPTPKPSNAMSRCWDTVLNTRVGRAISRAMKSNPAFASFIPFYTCSVYAILGLIYTMFDEVFPLWAMEPKVNGKPTIGPTHIHTQVAWTF